jgi:hypothetical protein
MEKSMIHISTDTHKSIAGRSFKPEDREPPEPGKIYVHVQTIDKFFEMCNATQNKYVVVTAMSDYGLAYQSEYPVWKDMKKWMESLLHMDKRGVDFEHLGYNPLIIPPRCDLEKCNIDHKYSIKCDSHTIMTFDKIPDNVHKWFITNCMIEHPLIECMPFGIQNNGASDLVSVKVPEKDKWLYVNFQTYTLHRFFLKGYLWNMADKNKDWMTFVPQASKPLNEYLMDIAKHKFVFSPNGNGVDCYRTWEALYLGSIPIVEKSATSSYFKDLPIVEIEDVKELSLDFLKRKYDDIKSRDDWNMDKLDLNYWKHIVEEHSNEINY